MRPGRTLNEHGQIIYRLLIVIGYYADTDQTYYEHFSFSTTQEAIERSNEILFDSGFVVAVLDSDNAECLMDREDVVKENWV